MAKDNLTLIAAEYKSLSRAQTVLEMVQEMKKARTINIADAAVVIKTPDGKLKVQETKELTGKKGARRGAIILGTIGLIFPPSFIASVLVGGGLGAIAGKLRDSGIKTDELERFANGLTEDHAAVMVLSHSDSISRVKGALQGYEGMIITQEIDADAAAQVAESVESEPMAEEAAPPEETTEAPTASSD